MNGKVYFVGTPIGNLGDITYRAIQVLSEVDIIACEDTRHSSILLQHYNIHKPTISYHKFNEAKTSQKILDYLRQGKNIAVISDAGMPMISDPGSVLIRELIVGGFQYTIIPGVSAVITAFAGSGLDSDRFCFVGFLPPKLIDRDKLLGQYIHTDSVLVFYSAVHEINNDLEYLYNTLGEKTVVVANELTKKFEKFFTGKLGELDILEPRGEYVILVKNEIAKSPLNDLTLEEHLDHYLEQGESKMNAIKMVAKDRQLKKSDVYNMLNKK